jgi:hypothetical protein
VRQAVEKAAPYAVAARNGARQATAYAAPRARRAATAARAGYDERLLPRLEQARAAAGPAGRKAKARSEAAMAALRAGVTPREIASVVRRRERRARCARSMRRAGLVAVAAAGAFAAWKWWERQSSPDWLMEPAPATEMPPEDVEEMAAEMDADANREAG